MRWQIEQFVFCDHKLTLINGQETQQLEPMVGELLKFFCQHHSDIITRDQLIAGVWQGRVITDNAVNRVVTKLRKVFADDAKKPKFIATYPKKGYKFIASVTAISEEHLDESVDALKAIEDNIPDNNLSNTNSPEIRSLKHISQQRRQLLIVSAILAFVMLFMTVWLGQSVWQPAEKSAEIFTQSKALTRNPGRESQPHVSPDGNYLMFTEFLSGKIHLRIKSLVDGSQISVEHGAENWVGPGDWNKTGDKLVYLTTTKDSCQYYLRDFVDMTLGEPKLIHNCPAGSFGKIIFTHDDDLLVFSEASFRGEPFTLFSLRLSTGEKRKLNQPELVLGGNSQYDLHPVENKLLLSSPDKQQWEGFYSLDLTTDQLTLLFKQDAFICCGIWDHTGERVVLLGEHPAYEFVSYDLTGEDREVVYSGNQQVSPPMRHSNGIDYLFGSGFSNQNIKLLSLDNGKSQLVAESSVDERLARFSQSGDSIIYLSVASGHEEIWFYDLEQKTTRQISHFNDARHYVDLHWSPDESFVVALSLNEIHIIDFTTGLAKVVKMPQREITGLSLKDNRTLAFSIKVGENWQVHHYDLASETLKPIDAKWQFVRYQAEQDDIIWQDKDGQYYVGEAQIMLDDEYLSTINFIERRHFNIQKVGSQFLYQEFNEGKYQLTSYDINSKERVVVSANDSSYFNRNKQSILLSEAVRSNADIFKTIASN
ncbi:winged helix-turn-helix domain-containing protein [Thalassotalea marina]|uniref:OmpR/PhoB-type domain-containing protein n=1 Tax=Thalassotalea marina TaxID=1673741 RepID=A0A919BNB6_9GAMM|nr:winged helix-turn-helix domain-containing protein [Thalassotalea marina]GHF99067.1 hypothetical protein GCM10017161_29290 [Thalassotalea marina]